MKNILTYCFVVFTLGIFAQMKVSNDTLHWSSAQKLTWTDFKGEVIEGIGINGEIFCMNLATFEKKNIFSKTEYQVVAVLDRSKTWIDPKLKTNSGLSYFQTTFDIYELHARKLRKEFSTTDFGNDPNSVFQEKYNNSMTQLMEQFNQYRKETKMGQDLIELKKWNQKIDSELKTLDDYKK